MIIMADGKFTVKMWKDFTEFDPIKENGELDLEGTLVRIAAVKSTPVEILEKEMAIEDLLPTYLECVKKVNEKVFAKINKFPNGVEGEGK